VRECLCRAEQPLRQLIEQSPRISPAKRQLRFIIGFDAFLQRQGRFYTYRQRTGYLNVLFRLGLARQRFHRHPRKTFITFSFEYHLISLTTVSPRISVPTCLPHPYVDAAKLGRVPFNDSGVFIFANLRRTTPFIYSAFLGRANSSSAPTTFAQCGMSRAR
jgi:hypothetical protein